MVQNPALGHGRVNNLRLEHIVRYSVAEVSVAAGNIKESSKLAIFISAGSSRLATSRYLSIRERP